MMANNDNSSRTPETRTKQRGGGGGGGDAKRELHSLMSDCTAMRDEARALEVCSTAKAKQSLVGGMRCSRHVQ